MGFLRDHQKMMELKFYRVGLGSCAPGLLKRERKKRMGIDSITGTYYGKKWEVSLSMDFGNTIWKKRGIKFLHRDNSFCQKERKVVKSLNKLDHKISKTLGRIIKYVQGYNNLGEIRDRLNKVYERAGKLERNAGQNLNFDDLFKTRFRRILTYSNSNDLACIHDGFKRLWPDIDRTMGMDRRDPNQLTQMDIVNLKEIEAEANAANQLFYGKSDTNILRQEDNQPHYQSNTNEPPMLMDTEILRQEDHQRLSQSNTAGNQRPDNDTTDSPRARQLRVREAARILANLAMYFPKSPSFSNNQEKKDK
jgi:hypothetical protein